MLPIIRALIRPSVILGVFICVIFALPMGALGDTQSDMVILPNDFHVLNLVELFREEGFAMVEDYTHLDDREDIAHNIIQQSRRTGFDTGLTVAICRYEDEYAPAATRLFYFQVETYLKYADSQIPRIWVDVDRMMRAFTETYNKTCHQNLKDTVTYYIVGQKFYPPKGFEGLNDEMKSEIEAIFEDAKKYQEIIDKPIEDTLIIEVGEPEGTGFDEGPPAYQPNYNYLLDEDVRTAYVSAILYFNPYLDEATANEIFEAIASTTSGFPGIDARFVMALVACESSFNPDCVSHAGAMGLGQLMPFTAEKHGVDDPYDISENIRATFEYLDNEFNRWAGYDNIYDYVLASYNAGAGAVKKYGGIPPYDETINYVYKVTKVYKNFLQEYEYKDYIYGKSKHYPDSAE
jgi:hypothetical protein